MTDDAWGRWGLVLESYFGPATPAEEDMPGEAGAGTVEVSGEEAKDGGEGKGGEGEAADFLEPLVSRMCLPQEG